MGKNGKRIKEKYSYEKHEDHSSGDFQAHEDE